MVDGVAKGIITAIVEKGNVNFRNFVTNLERRILE
jgi:hypothetical protein